jgi:hypothetical protein
VLGPSSAADAGRSGAGRLSAGSGGPPLTSRSKAADAASEGAAGLGTAGAAAPAGIVEEIGSMSVNPVWIRFRLKEN